MNRRTRKTTIAVDAPAEESTPEILSDLLGQPRTSSGATGVTVGKLCDWSSTGDPLVEFPGHPGGAPIPARSTIALDQHSLDAPVVLVFEGDDPNRPIIIGVIQPPSLEATVAVDGREVVLEGEERVELRCGKAKIVLTSDGKVLIKGTDIVSRSEGPNRIKGASIQIN